MGLFGGKSDSSKAQGSSQVVLNSSGWVVGKGNANGGKTSASTNDEDLNTIAGLPPIAWASLGLVVLGMVFLKKRRKKA